MLNKFVILTPNNLKRYVDNLVYVLIKFTSQIKTHASDDARKLQNQELKRSRTFLDKVDPNHTKSNFFLYKKKNYVSQK